VWLRKAATPVIVQRLPDSDAIIYLNQGPLRADTLRPHHGYAQRGLPELHRRTATHRPIDRGM